MNRKKTIVTISTLLSIVLCCFSALCCVSAYAATVPKMPLTVTALGRTLKLNGAGLRTATVFHINVYEAGLYLLQRSSNPQQILNSPDIKVVRLAFFRNVTSDEVRGAWKDEFKKNCQPNCAALQPVFDQLVSQMPEAKSGDVFAYVFSSKGIHVVRNGKEVGHSDDPELAKAVLSFWLGNKPPSIELKQALLGLIQSEDVS